MRRGHELVPLALLALSVAGCHKARVVSPPQPIDSVRQGSKPPSTPVPPPPPGSTDAREAAVQRQLLADLGNVIHFDFNEDTIKPEDRPVLDRKAAILLANSALRIRITGHADERGSDEYNLVLGNKRALAAKRYLESKGVNGSRIEITSLGEERPVDPASNEIAWAKNRRAEFEILAGPERLVPPK